jgi:hypothetical protein
MAINMNSTSNSVNEIKYTSASVTEADVIKLILDGTTVWAKPFRLFLNIGNGISSVNVTRTSKTDPAADTNTIVTSSKTIPVYYGETISVTPRALSGYTLSVTWPQTFTIVENTALNISATTPSVQLLPPVITDVQMSYVKEERRFDIRIFVTNPNTVKVRVSADYLAKVGYYSATQVAYSGIERSKNIEAGGSGTLYFTDFDDQLGLREWAENFTFFMVRCYDDNVNVGVDYLASVPVFWCNNPLHNIGYENECNGKIPVPTVSAKYTAPAAGQPYQINLSVMSGWDFPVKLVLTTPTGITEIDRTWNWGSYSSTTLFDIPAFSVDSLDAVVKAQLLDRSPFGLIDSDEVIFNLADARLDEPEDTR